MCYPRSTNVTNTYRRGVDYYQPISVNCFTCNSICLVTYCTAHSLETIRLVLPGARRYLVAVWWTMTLYYTILLLLSSSHYMAKAPGRRPPRAELLLSPCVPEEARLGRNDRPWVIGAGVALCALNDHVVALLPPTGLKGAGYPSLGHQTQSATKLRSWSSQVAIQELPDRSRNSQVIYCD